ncbi:MAG: VOC family protein [Bacteroidia bacterium]
MNQTILSIGIILSLNFLACSGQINSNLDTQKHKSTVNSAVNSPGSYVAIFEIPATNISRAIKFYQAILDINIQKIEIPEMQMGLFPSEGQAVFGVIIEGEGYTPSPNGVTIYLNAGNDVQIVLDKIEKNGGKIIVPKTLHADESGYFALFLDTEGNRLGLHSPN